MRYIIFTTFEEKKYYFVSADNFTRNVDKARQYKLQSIAEKYRRKIKGPWDMRILEVD